jgi:hypothetical protein
MEFPRHWLTILPLAVLLVAVFGRDTLGENLAADGFLSGLLSPIFCPLRHHYRVVGPGVQRMARDG